jgi:LPXTG-motif cell wall-anchored protein
MSASQIAGIGILIVGAILLVVGFNASQAPLDQISNALTGRFTDQTMWYIIAGIVALVGGGLLALFGRRRA